MLLITMLTTCRPRLGWGEGSCMLLIYMQTEARVGGGVVHSVDLHADSRLGWAGESCTRLWACMELTNMQETRARGGGE